MADKMTDKQLGSDEARRNFKDMLNDVEHRGYHVTILRYDRPAAVLVPVEWYERKRADEQAFRSMGQTLRDLEGGKQ